MEGLKAFTATGYDGTDRIIWMTRVMRVQAGEGLLLKGTPGQTYTIPSAGAQVSYGNMIVSNTSGEKISISETDGDWTNYYLKDGKYQQVNGTATIGNNKSYLQLPTALLAGGAGTRGVADGMVAEFVEVETESMPIFGSIAGDDDTTGIKAIGTSEQEQDVWYNLQGQRVENPGKGLFIHNGRKVVIK